MSRFYGTKRKASRNVFSVSVAAKSSSLSWRKLSIWISGCIVSCVIVAFVAQWTIDRVLERAFYQNEDFTIRKIEVDVNGTLSQGEVVRWSGVRMGQNLFQVDLERVKQELLLVPYIGEVTVERRLPGTIKIKVEERQPVALLQPRSKKGYRLAQAVYYLDASGVVMKPKPGERLRQLPTLTGLDSEKVAEGLQLDDAGVTAALKLLKLSEISPARVNLDLNEIDVGHIGLLNVKTRDGGLICFGHAFLDQQLKRLEVIYEYAQGEHAVVKTVDLTPERNVPVTFF